MSRLRLIATLVIVLISSGCATTTPYNPFKITEEEFYGKTKTIALAPVAIPEDLENKEQLKAKFEALVESKLQKAGFVVIPSREYAEIWDRMTKQMGGYFDPVTGRLDEAKFKAVKEHCLREMHTKFNADAVLHSGIRVVTAKFEQSKAVWHGTSESLSSVWATLFVTHRGTVPALSFGVDVEDTNGVDEYVNWGGIQVLSKISGGKLVPIAQNELLASEERNTAAVNIALDPLVRKRTSSPEPKTKP
jgi:hypothetical protein